MNSKSILALALVVLPALNGCYGLPDVPLTAEPEGNGPSAPPAPTCTEGPGAIDRMLGHISLTALSRPCGAGTLELCLDVGAATQCIVVTAGQTDVTVPVTSAMDAALHAGVVNGQLRGNISPTAACLAAPGVCDDKHTAAQCQAEQARLDLEAHPAHDDSLAVGCAELTGLRFRVTTFAVHADGSTDVVGSVEPWGL